MKAKKLMSLLLAIATLLSVIPAMSITASAEDDLNTYLSPVYNEDYYWNTAFENAKSGIKEWETKDIPSNCLTINQTLVNGLSPYDSYYTLYGYSYDAFVVEGDVTFECYWKIEGDVKLILKNHSSLRVPGIVVTNSNEDYPSNSLTIYAQSTNADEMGTLTSDPVSSGGATSFAGIGGWSGDYYNYPSCINGSYITINGGKITATGTHGGAGIGGAYYDGGWSENYGGDCSNIIINGGYVTATGSNTFGGTNGGAGIGAGYSPENGNHRGSCSKVVINGGNITAKGHSESLAIGGATYARYGSYGDSEDIYINSKLSLTGYNSESDYKHTISDDDEDDNLTDELSSDECVVYLEIVEPLPPHYHNKGENDEIEFDVGLTQANINSYLSDEDTYGYMLEYGHNYYLAENIKLDHCIVIANDTHFCLNGYVLCAPSGDCAIKQTYDDLYIYDCNSSKKTHYYTVDANGVWKWNDDNKTNAVSVDALTAMPSENTIVSIEGGAITGGTGSDTGFGGGIFLNGGNLTIYGGTIVGNSAKGNQESVPYGVNRETYDLYGGGGGGIGVNPTGACTLDGCMIVGNLAEDGGGLYAAGYANVDFISGKINFNTSPNRSGGVQISTDDDRSFDMTGGEICYNKGGKTGGVEVEQGIFHMTGGKITKNTALSGAQQYAYSGVVVGSYATMILGGTAYIYDNANGTNLFLYSNKEYVNIDPENPLTSTAKIGITTALMNGTTVLNGKLPTAGNPITITGASAADYSAYFVSDNANYYIYNSVSADGSDADALPDQKIKLTIDPVYTINWKNGSTTLATTKAASGETPVYPNAAPTGTQTFLGWATSDTATSAETLSAATANATYFTVFKAAVAVTGVSLNKSTTSLPVGETETLTATVSPDNADDKTVTWSTSDATVATVSNGTVTAVKVGTATITATADGKSAECVVTVVPHEHSWAYSVNGATFTATCNGSGTCDSTATGLSIVAPSDLSYNDQAKSCTISATALGDKTGISAGSIKYYVKGQSTEMSGKPTELGTYVAKLTIENVGTAELEFTIVELSKPVILSYGSTVAGYDTIAAAVSAAGTNVATITLNEDNLRSDNVDIKSGQKITVDLNGKTITTNDNSFRVNSGGEMTLVDNSTSGTGKIVGDTGDNVTRGFEVKGKLTMKGGTITDTSMLYSGGGVYVVNGGIFIMDGGTITDCIAGNSSGGGVYVGQGTFTMNGGTISGCNAKDGAGVYVNSGTFTMKGGTISGGNATNNGGGAFINTGCTFTITGGTISENFAANAGGAMYLAGATFNAGGGTITENVSGYGGVFCRSGTTNTITLSGDTQITGNTDKNGNVWNLYLNGFTVNVSNPGSKMNVGVKHQNGTGNVTGTNGTDYSMYFSSDNTNYTVKNDSNTVKLVSTGEISTNVSGVGYSASLTLNKNIDINFRMSGLGTDNNGTGFDTSKLSITVDGTGWTDYTVKNNVLSGVLKAVAPKDIGTALHIVVTYDNVQVKSFNYSVKSYCEAVFNAQANDTTGKYDTLADLCEALLNYGKYAQDYANGNTDSTVNEGHAATFDNSYVFTGVNAAKATLGNYAKAGSSAYLTLNSTIKLNFALTSCTEDLSTGYDENGNVDEDNPQNFFVLNGKNEQIDPKRVKVTTDGTNTLVSIDLYASQLSTSYTLKLKGVDTSKFCITFGVYNYCANAQGYTAADGFTDTVKTLCKAIHNYSRAVDAYIASTAK